MGFLLRLGFREVGAPFALSPLPTLERKILADLAQLGLVLPFRCTWLKALALDLPCLSCLRAICPVLGQN